MAYKHLYTIYLFISNAIKMQETHIHSFWYGSFCQLFGNLAIQTDASCFRLLAFKVIHTLFFLFAFISFNPCFTAWVCHGVFTMCFLLLIYITYALS